ncbi:hypothetical protein B9G98_00156 [Wickerhamiella sorbophila]|uniref:Uncharacterized protein n=1 Tax=Wickerhamiella sorbophila TaxID=45607 RepID=A0A2T0FC13_9ASCO|nr:hypothetical protein B9G98_00156 [Wickerhamiella sorbophila]PRT52536.1 hypothetical protein B9G98_00156 [Wickerhamiella sorbophila]
MLRFTRANWYRFGSAKRPFTRFYATEPEKNERLANLGSTIQVLQDNIPLLLTKNLPYEIIHPDICFCLFPETHGIQAAGFKTYNTMVKLLQLATRSLLLPNRSQLMILAMYMNKDDKDPQLQVNWRSISPDRATPQPIDPFSNPLSIFQPGQIIKSLGMMPDEYPIIAGSFEFRFDRDCDKIVYHCIRDVEYLHRPSAEPVITN